MGCLRRRAFWVVFVDAIGFDAYECVGGCWCWFGYLVDVEHVWCVDVDCFYDEILLLLMWSGRLLMCLLIIYMRVVFWFRKFCLLVWIWVIMEGLVRVVC